MYLGFREMLATALGLFGITTEDSPALQVARNYNLIEGVYVPNKKRLTLLRGDWSQLSG